jgi:protein-disulfide isomerase
VNDTINADIAAFKKTGATEATPTFFLDGKKIETTASVDSFAKQIDAEIANKN